MFWQKPYGDMNILEKAIYEAAKQSPSIKKLIDLQDAYIHATQAMQRDGTHADILVFEACTFAIQSHAIWMAEKAEASEDIIRTLKAGDCFNWYETIYFFYDKIPSIRKFIDEISREIPTD